MIGVPRHAETWQMFAPARRWVFLAVLFLVGTSSAMDRGIISILLQPLKEHFALSDSLLGLLSGMPFGLCYALSSLPLARLADRRGRKIVLFFSAIGWSVMTALCGLATSVPFLFLARMGVGLAEGGTVAPSHALIADYFPPARRAMAIAVFTASGTLSLLLVSIVGSWVAQNYGWRGAFFVMASLSLPVALLVPAVLREPVRMHRPGMGSRSATLRTDLGVLLRKKAFAATLVALFFYTALPFGVIVFVPTYMTRTLHLPLAQAGALFGVVTACGAAIGSLGGGYAGDFIRRFQTVWMLRMPALVLLASLFVSVGSLLVDRVGVFLALLGVNTALLYSVTPMVFATVQHICGAARRATATAAAFVVLNAIGIALPPLALGALSDAYLGWSGESSLRYAMLTMCLFLAPAAACLWLGARHVAHDHED